MIDIKSETTLLVGDVSAHPALNRQPRIHPSTPMRWVHRGILGSNGTRVKLEAFRLGGRWYTSVEALQRFAARLSGGTAPTTTGKAKLSQNAQAADAALEQFGY